MTQSQFFALSQDAQWAIWDNIRETYKSQNPGLHEDAATTGANQEVLNQLPFFTTQLMEQFFDM